MKCFVIIESSFFVVQQITAFRRLLSPSRTFGPRGLGPNATQYRFNGIPFEYKVRLYCDFFTTTKSAFGIIVALAGEAINLKSK